MDSIIVSDRVVLQSATLKAAATVSTSAPVAVEPFGADGGGRPYDRKGERVVLVGAGRLVAALLAHRRRGTERRVRAVGLSAAGHAAVDAAHFLDVARHGRPSLKNPLIAARVRRCVGGRSQTRPQESRALQQTAGREQPTPPQPPKDACEASCRLLVTPCRFESNPTDHRETKPPSFSSFKHTPFEPLTPAELGHDHHKAPDAVSSLPSSNTACAPCTSVFASALAAFSSVRLSVPSISPAKNPPPVIKCIRVLSHASLTRGIRIRTCHKVLDPRAYNWPHDKTPRENNHCPGAKHLATRDAYR